MTHPDANTAPGTSTRSSLVLRLLTERDEAEARAAHRELAADGFDFLLFLEQDEPWSSYLQRTEKLRTGVDLPEGRVPSTFLVAEVEGRIVGRVSVRHALNPWLERWGGHIGYAVRPEFRTRGFAAEMLRQALLVAAGLGLERVLVTCEIGNTGSAAVIEKCGGRFERLEPGEAQGAPLRRYWIDVPVQRP